MQKFTFVFRSHFALIAALACLSLAGCDAATAPKGQINQENGRLFPSIDVNSSDRRAENISKTEPEKNLADRRAAEDAQNKKVEKECDDLLNNAAVELFRANVENNPEKYLANIVDIYARLFANLRSLDASGCSSKFQNAFKDFVAHIEKLANLSQELQTLQQRDESELDHADLQRILQIGEEFERLSNQVNSEANKLKAAM